MVANQFQHVAVTYDEVSGMATLYRNGGVVRQEILGRFSLVTNGIVNIGLRDARVGTEGSFRGLIDEVRIYNRALSAAEIKAIYDTGSVG